MLEVCASDIATRSGELNAKTRELQALQALAQSRLKSARRNFADGIQAAKDVQRDLEWTQGRVGQVSMLLQMSTMMTD